MMFDLNLETSKTMARDQSPNINIFVKNFTFEMNLVVSRQENVAKFETAV